MKFHFTDKHKVFGEFQNKRASIEPSRQVISFRPTAFGGPRSHVHGSGPCRSSRDVVVFLSLRRPLTFAGHAIECRTKFFFAQPKAGRDCCTSGHSVFAARETCSLAFLDTQMIWKWFPKTLVDLLDLFCHSVHISQSTHSQLVSL
jgi:hypothetical protein